MIPKISFGNIYKVNASYFKANDILRRAQLGELSADSLELLYEGEKNPYVFALVDDGVEVPYIATGKDAKKCSDAYDTAYKDVDNAHTQYCGDTTMIDTDVESAWEKYRNTLKRLVEENNPAVLDVEFDNITGEPISVSTNAPKSVDIIA